MEVVGRGEEEVEGGWIGVDEVLVSNAWFLIFTSLLHFALRFSVPCLLRCVLCFGCRSFRFSILPPVEVAESPTATTIPAS